VLVRPLGQDSAAAECASRAPAGGDRARRTSSIVSASSPDRDRQSRESDPAPPPNLLAISCRSWRVVPVEAGSVGPSSISSASEASSTSIFPRSLTFGEVPVPGASKPVGGPWGVPRAPACDLLRPRPGSPQCRGCRRSGRDDHAKVRGFVVLEPVRDGRSGPRSGVVSRPVRGGPRRRG